MAKRIVYGPLLSRRLGRSLGVDAIKTADTKKNCNYDCVYCQLGHVPKKITGTDEPEGIVTPDEIVEGIRTYHKNIENLDYITFSGTCEPTLNPLLGEMIRKVKEISTHPVCVITNSSLLGNREVRENLADADLLVATLVSGYEKTFQAINRPAEGIRLEDIINGLKEIRRMDKHPKLGIEVMLVDVSEDTNIDFPVNHTEKEIGKLKEVLKEIDPDEIEILSVSRPPAEKYIVPVPEERLRKIALEFEKEFGEERVKLVLKGLRRSRSVMKHGNLEEEVYDLILRRPCTFKQISASLGIDEGKLKPIIEKLASADSIKEIDIKEQKYYKAS
ncbi:radical SAM protein [Methanolobus sp. WCC1]|uniref:radical SAM protein n=1 Tax=unclassified Methanolobus TaxID=2629569 RepID=UPI003246EF8C